jgi:ribosomal 30S subunit maturation factor RimM
MPRLEVPLVSRHVGDIDLDARRIEVLSLEGLS